jgi:hypothetical protein
MQKDAADRRLRFAPPNPKARPKRAPRRIALQPADIEAFSAINRHGPLPSNYLYEFTKHLRRDETQLKNRLTEFYNGDEGGPYLTRPEQQFGGFEARYQHIVYGLAPRAKEALLERGVRVAPARRDAFLHQLMQACCGASFELLARSLGLRYISRSEIFDHPRAGTCREAPDPMALPVGQHRLVPDDLFGIEYPEAGFRFFAVEVDRNTESIERRRPDQNAFGRKVAHYAEVLDRKTFHSWWGVRNLHILTITTNATHAGNLADYVAKTVEGRFQDRFAFTVATEFGPNWRVPKKLMTQLFEPWVTPVGTKDIGRP